MRRSYFVCKSWCYLKISLSFSQICAEGLPRARTFIFSCTSYFNLTDTSFLGLQGYAAREFVKLGLQPGELAIISKEAVCCHLMHA